MYGSLNISEIALMPWVLTEKTRHCIILQQGEMAGGKKWMHHETCYNHDETVSYKKQYSHSNNGYNVQCMYLAKQLIIIT